MTKTKYNQTLMKIEIIPQSVREMNFHTSGIHVCLSDVVVLLPGTGNTSTNMLASSQHSNLLSQRSTSLAQPIKAGFIPSPLPVPQHPPPFLLGRCFISWVRYRRSNLVKFSSKLFYCW